MKTKLKSYPFAKLLDSELIYFLIMISFLPIHIPNANAEMKCGVKDGKLNSIERKELINEFTKQLGELEKTYQECCDNDCSFAIDNKTIDIMADVAGIASAMAYLGYIGYSAYKGKIVNPKLINWSSVIVPNIINPTVKNAIKLKYGKDKIECTEAKRDNLNRDLKAMKNKITKISDSNLVDICNAIVRQTIQEKKETVLIYTRSAEINTELNQINNVSQASTRQPEVKASVIQTTRSLRTIANRRPRPEETRNTGWDHYCKGDGQDYCAFLIYAGKNAFREQYAVAIGNYDIQDAHIRINAVTDDVPPNPYVLNYELIISINGHKLPEQLKLTKIGHGKPVGGPFDNFADETIVLPASSYQYFVSGDNEISYRLAGPVGSWIVFKWSELSVKLK